MVQIMLRQVLIEFFLATSMSWLFIHTFRVKSSSRRFQAHAFWSAGRAVVMVKKQSSRYELAFRLSEVGIVSPRPGERILIKGESASIALKGTVDQVMIDHDHTRVLVKV